ncbi:hypothetical protein V6N13_053620 [Hibiscus sabdariffa]
MRMSDEMVLKGEGKLECRLASIIEFTRPDSTHFGNVQCQSHRIGARKRYAQREEDPLRVSVVSVGNYTIFSPILLY